MGAPAAVGTAMVICTFGMAPSTLNPIPNRVLIGGKPAATITDMSPANIPPFGMCTTPSNPSVAAATAAALGVLTPMPCQPVVPAPWTPAAPTTLIAGKPVLAATAQCFCAWGGAISIMQPGQVTTLV